MPPRDRSDVLEVVTRVVHSWDPYGLLAGGCPADEFDSEIRAVCRQTSRIRSAIDAAHVLSRVFRSSFNDNERFSPEACKQSGEALYAALRATGAVD